jgi:hypothetical protein
VQREALSARDLGIVGLAKAGISTCVLLAGFRAVSDDDFARIVIAQRFVFEPSLDPSGTSWLPFPFWVQGAVMTLFGRGVEVARATSFVLGVLAPLLLLVAARWAGLPRRAALAGAILGSAIPYAAWLGVATVPDLPAAALIALGIGAASTRDLCRRLFGALALCAAALSRYEAWPVAAGFSLLSLYDAQRLGRRALAAPAALAALGPAGWLLHGALSHGDPFFFVARVSDYKRALGGGQDVLAALTGQPLAILRCEPELAGLTAIALVTALALRRRDALRRHRRPFALLGLLIGFLVAGELGASGATHHAERAVLVIWLWLALFSSDLAFDAWPGLRQRARWVLAATGAAAILLGALVLRPWYARRDSFVDRSTELAIGRLASRHARTGDRLLIDTPDFGFYAVIAGFAQPERAAPITDHDPRRPPAPDPFASEPPLRERVAQSQARLVVVRDEHLPIASRLGAVLERRSPYTLIAVEH